MRRTLELWRSGTIEVPIDVHRRVQDACDLESTVGFPEDDDVAPFGVGVEPAPELRPLVPQTGVPRQPGESNRDRIDR